MRPWLPMPNILLYKLDINFVRTEGCKEADCSIEQSDSRCTTSTAVVLTSLLQHTYHYSWGCNLTLSTNHSTGIASHKQINLTYPAPQEKKNCFSWHIHTRREYITRFTKHAGEA